MDPTPTPTEFYAQSGRNRTVHRGVVTSAGVRVIGTERCNLDDALIKPVEVPDISEVELARFCGWCFPNAHEPR